MSLLKKLQKLNNKVSRTKVRVVRETIKDPNEAQAEQQNAAFRLLTGNYVLLQRIMKARDIIYIQRRNGRTGAIENIHEEKMDKLVSDLYSAIEKSDEFFRDKLLVSPQDVTDVDVLAHYFYEVIEGMERMSVNDLEVMRKVTQTILTSGRYMHIDSEQAYLQNLLVVAQHGMELAKKGRKTVTLNDIKKLIKTN